MEKPKPPEAAPTNPGVQTARRTVYLLLEKKPDRNPNVCAVYEMEADANSKAAHYGADPEDDTEYFVEPWSVT